MWRPERGPEARGVSAVSPLDETGVVGLVHAPWPLLARGLSLEAGGLWMAGEESLTWVRGKRVAYLVPAGRLLGLQQAREALQGQGVPVTSWSMGGIARQGLRWIGARTIPRAGTIVRLWQAGWAYHCWQAGEYAEAGLYDLEAAYYTALQRLPSPCVDWLADGPCWHPLPPEGRARWRALLAVAGVTKPLRLCLVGVMGGSGGGGVTYHRGERVPRHRECGPFKAGALAVVRAVHELCALAAVEEEALWAHTDAVILPGKRQPRAWERYGYAYREEARGPADIRHAHVYRVGDKQTASYQAGARLSLPDYRPSVPSPLTLTAWH